MVSKVVSAIFKKVFNASIKPRYRFLIEMIKILKYTNKFPTLVLSLRTDI
jgi:hypothetical protein